MAQQEQSAEPRQEAADQPRANQRKAGQVDRSRPDQRERVSRSRNEGENADAQGPEVERYLANCLLAKNEAEVILSEFAKERAENAEVKQFAEMMVEDHRQMVDKLQPMAGARSETLDNSKQRGGRSPTAGDGGAMQQLAEIDRQIVERCTQALKEELQAKSGAEFDKAYLGAAVSAHMHALAALKVIEQQAAGQLAQFASDARPKVQEHLERAKQLKEQHKGTQAARQSDRSQK